MNGLRAEEDWVRACMQEALPSVEVQQHDDGSRPGMYDLKLVRAGDGFGAVEISAAADAETIELWNLMNGKGRWIEPALAGGWAVSLLPSSRAKRVRVELPRLLAALEQQGVSEVLARRRRAPFSAEAADLGVVMARQSETEYPGSIYPTIELAAERSGGVVPESGDALAGWLGNWLREPGQADIPGKLRLSGMPERHAFVILPGFTTAPFEVSDVLMRPTGPIPVAAPNLPPEITHVWAMSTWTSGDGFWWSPSTGWSRFLKIFEDGL